jgi:heat shock protein HslJ
MARVAEFGGPIVLQQVVSASALAIALLSIAAGCRTPGQVAPSSDRLGGTSWVVEQIDGRDAVERARPTVVFDAAAERVSGRASCNRYSAGVTRAGETLRIAQAVTTKMACAPPLMEQEARFLAVLGAVATHRREGDRLLLIDGNGRERLRLSRAPDAYTAPDHYLAGN